MVYIVMTEKHYGVYIDNRKNTMVYIVMTEKHYGVYSDNRKILWCV